MGKSITNSVYVGLDVHKDSIDIALAEAGHEGEVRHLGSIGGDLATLDRALRTRAGSSLFFSPRPFFLILFTCGR